MQRKMFLDSFTVPFLVLGSSGFSRWDVPTTYRPGRASRKRRSPLVPLLASSWMRTTGFLCMVGSRAEARSPLQMHPPLVVAPCTPCGVKLRIRETWVLLLISCVTPSKWLLLSEHRRRPCGCLACDLLVLISSHTGLLPANPRTLPWAGEPGRSSQAGVHQLPLAAALRRWNTGAGGRTSQALSLGWMTLKGTPRRPSFPMGLSHGCPQQ